MTGQVEKQLSFFDTRTVAFACVQERMRREMCVEESKSLVARKDIDGCIGVNYNE